MNEGMISKRYARALLQYAVGQKVEDTVFSEMKRLAAVYAEEPKLRMAMDNPMLSKENKLKLVLAIVDNKASKQFEQFAKLVISKNRERHLRSIALSYVDLYCELKDITTGKLITATEVDDATIEKMKALAGKVRSGKLDFETQVDPDIDGGFILFVDTYRLDASIRTQLNRIKQDLILENSKIS